MSKNLSHIRGKISINPIYNLYLDTNIIIEKGFKLDKYSPLSQLSNSKNLKVYINEFVIKELKSKLNETLAKINKDYKEVQKLLNKFNIANNLFSSINFNPDENNIIHQFVNGLNLIIIKNNQEIYSNAFNDYFLKSNTFEINDQNQIEKNKKKIIDSIIAHAYLYNAKAHNSLTTNILVTNNIKDFKWLENHNFKIFASIIEFSKQYYDKLVVLENKKFGSKISSSILNVIPYSDIKDILLNQIAKQMERIEIRSNEFPFNLNEYVIVDLPIEEWSKGNIKNTKVQLYKELITQHNEHYELSLPFIITFNQYATSVVSLGDLIANDIVDNNLKINKKFKKVILDIEYRKDVGEVSMQSNISLVGQLNIGPFTIPDFKLNNLNKISKKVILSEIESTARPIIKFFT